jgi:predicted carbohydrate-binding protein with CBM5 and CBM33 domain
MPVRPRLARVLAAAIAAPLLTVALAGAASAHGAPVGPVSRSFACGSVGSFTRTAACTAARAGDQGQWFRQWDNVRVADVNGKDRQKIPDGKLCSGGIAGFGGLDLARADWPSTSVRAGKPLTIRYRATIAHQGSFRMYVTRDGYSPKRALRWADLESTPFVSVKDPEFTDGAYRFGATLPSGKVGRHVLYTVWQNSSTSDTYYSCSDVVFTKAAGTAAGTRAAPARPTPAAVKVTSTTRTPSRKPHPRATTTAPTASSSPARASAPSARPTDVSLGAVKNLSNDVGDHSTVLLSALAAGLLVLAAGGGGMVIARRGRRNGARGTGDAGTGGQAAGGAADGGQGPARQGHGRRRR